MRCAPVGVDRFTFGLGVAAQPDVPALVSLLAAGRSGPVQRQLERLDPWLRQSLGGLGVGSNGLASQVPGVGYDTIGSLARHSERPWPSQLAGPCFVEVLGHRGFSNARVLSAVALLLSLFPCPLLVIAMASGWARAACIGRCRTTGYAMVGMAAVLAGSARARSRACCCCLSSPTTFRIVLPLMGRHRLSAL